MSLQGTNLSGGQKQRVSIARAIYADADIILLDDTLSALDSKVAKEIYDRCINGHWRRLQKTIVFVTNRLEFVSQSDNVAVVENGRIVAWGPPQQLAQTSVEYRELMQPEAGDAATEAEAAPPLDVDVGEILRLITPAAAAAAPGESDSPRNVTFSSGKSINAGTESDDDDELLDPHAKVTPVQPARGQLISAETHAEGGVGGKLLRQYSEAMGGLWVLILILFTFVWIEGLRLYASIWIQQWTTDLEDGSKEHSNSYYIGV